MAHVTMKDVAAAVEMDPSTVSRVLYGTSKRHKYDPKTVTRIREAAKRLGYRPSNTARALRSGKTALIGLVVADIASPFFAELAGRIEGHLGSAGYRLVISNTGECADRQEESIEEMIQHPMDGAIVAPSGHAGLIKAKNSGLAIVTVDRPSGLDDIAHVGLDDRQAGQMIGERLRQRGYHRIGVILPDSPDDPGIAQRLQGLQDGLGKQGQVMWSVPGPRTSFAPDASNELCDRMQQQMPQALVGLNLTCNLTALAAISRLNLLVPQTIGLIGLDDFPTAAFWRPPITIVAQPIEQIAQQAVELLIEQINSSGQAAARNCLLPPVLMERGSL